MIEMTRTIEPDREPRRGEDVEELEPLEGVDDAPPERRVVAGVEVGHRVLVVADRAERERRQLLERHPDEGENATGR